MVFTACNSQTWWWINGVLFWVFPSPCFVDYVLSIANVDRAVQVIESPGDDLEGVIELPCPFAPPPPPAPKLKVHFRRLRKVFKPPQPHSKARMPRLKRVFRPPTPRSKARMPPPSKVWKARRPRRNLPWPLLPQRSTPFPRSSSMKSRAKARIATPKMHPASWSMTSIYQ